MHALSIVVNLRKQCSFFPQIPCPIHYARDAEFMTQGEAILLVCWVSIPIGRGDRTFKKRMREATLHSCSRHHSSVPAQLRHRPIYQDGCASVVLFLLFN
jgi:hypothetical protein